MEPGGGACARSHVHKRRWRFRKRQIFFILQRSLMTSEWCDSSIVSWLHLSDCMNKTWSSPQDSTGSRDCFLMIRTERYGTCRMSTASSSARNQRQMWHMGKVLNGWRSSCTPATPCERPLNSQLKFCESCVLTHWLRHFRLILPCFNKVMSITLLSYGQLLAIYANKWQQSFSFGIFFNSQRNSLTLKINITKFF